MKLCSNYGWKLMIGQSRSLTCRGRRYAPRVWSGLVLCQVLIFVIFLGGCAGLPIPIIGKEKKVDPIVNISMTCSEDCNSGRPVRVAILVLSDATRFQDLPASAVFGSEAESTRTDLGVEDYRVISVPPGQTITDRLDLSDMTDKLSGLSVGIIAHFATVTAGQADRYLIGTKALELPATINIQILAGSLTGSATVRD